MPFSQPCNAAGVAAAVSDIQGPSPKKIYQGPWFEVGESETGRVEVVALAQGRWPPKIDVAESKTAGVQILTIGNRTFKCAPSSYPELLVEAVIAAKATTTDTTGDGSGKGESAGREKGKRKKKIKKGEKELWLQKYLSWSVQERGGFLFSMWRAPS